MKPNTNPETGIPYGVISTHSLDPDLVSNLFDRAENLSYKQRLEDFLKAKRRENEHLSDEEWADREVELECNFNDECESCEDSYEGSYEGVSYGLSTLGGAYLLWLYESPVTGLYSPCSPCVPGAGDINNPDPYGIECYDVPSEWRS